ncbi:hypothetical protein [Fontibacter flavus]|uniref:Uncharacterized protein n=1 Tax=Fontibacter flavus TaxID=654838 RepID=A0ABV6FV01_9BACT
MEIKIFYSWQTSTKTKYNKNFILNCLEKATKKLNRKPDYKGINFKVLEGVRDEPGSPSVASTITDLRIPNCDIFVADLSVVNHIPNWKKGIRKWMGDPFKPFQNNNVLNEHGVAKNALGNERIIGVLNNIYGSPNNNPENIPFDLRHLRFPIEYSYSKRTKDIEKVKNQLINTFCSAVEEVVLHVLRHQKEKYLPFITWNGWLDYNAPSKAFCTNDKIVDTISQIKSGINEHTKSIRLLGLSGLGKTRIVLEAFRETEEQNVDGVPMKNKVLYIDCNVNEGVNYHSILSKLSEDKEDKVIIIDNCSKSLHRRLLPLINNDNNSLSLITIDSNPEEFELDRINGVSYILFKKEDLSSVVNDILQEDLAILGEDTISKIKEFSQGIPLMAVLISESMKEGEKYVGRLDDKDLLDKLLGKKGEEETWRTILRSCSIFNYFGYEDELKSQLEFIAKNNNITSLEIGDQIVVNKFYEVCSHYLKREIFERKGRLIGMRPFPLAMYLAQEWLEPCTPERLVQVINSISELDNPDRKNLSEAMAEQMKYLGYNEKAKEIIEKIAGPNGPFDNAEVLNTELGSRFFRSFVEVNPIAVAKNFTRIFSLPPEELYKIDEGRRNIVWVLEKLCFDRRTFLAGAKTLFSFAVAENETWANNATGQFIQLFKILLPGTEANLDERWAIIEWGLDKNEPKYYELAIKAMASGLSYGHFSRTGGAEQQGTMKLLDYQPSWEEVSTYWNRILLKLVSIIKSKEHFKDEVCDIIANSIRSISNAGFARIILKYIVEVAEIKNYDWDEGLKGLKEAFKYEKTNLNVEELGQIELLIDKMTKKDFQSKYVNISNSYYLETEDYSSEGIKDAVINLADEFISQELSWEENLPLIFSRQVIFSFYFGRRVYELIEGDKLKVMSFLEDSVSVIKEINIKDRNITAFIGFATQLNDEEKSQFYHTLKEDEDLNYLLFSFLASDPEGWKYFELLFELIDKGKCELSGFQYFTHANSLSQFDYSELEKFSKKLFSYGKEGYELVFDMFFSLGFHNEEIKNKLIPIFKECIYTIGINKEAKHQLDGYRWSQTICDILNHKDETEFAVFINKLIIDSFSRDNMVFSSDSDFQRIYEVLMKIHFQSVWTDLSNALLYIEDDFVKFYGLKSILGSRIGGVGRRSVGILFDGDIEKIFNWCSTKKPLAPARLAELVPIYAENNNQYTEWHPYAKRLIDDFGHIKEVLISLNSNMGTFSWTGSLVPLLEAQKELFLSIKNHEIQLVSEWVMGNLDNIDEQIKRERNRDQETYL